MLKDLAGIVSTQRTEIGLAGSAFVNAVYSHAARRAKNVPELLSSKVPDMLINLRLGMPGLECLQKTVSVTTPMMLSTLLQPQFLHAWAHESLSSKAAHSDLRKAAIPFMIGRQF